MSESNQSNNGGKVNIGLVIAIVVLAIIAVVLVVVIVNSLSNNETEADGEPIPGLPTAIPGGPTVTATNNGPKPDQIRRLAHKGRKAECHSDRVPDAGEARRVQERILEETGR